MTKQELLKKLATDCATWEESVNILDNIACSYWVRGIPYGITMSDWLAERERLLNKPSWNDAPEWATHLGTTGKYWHWLLNACRDDRIGCSFWYAADKSQVSNKVIATPAGYDWRESLEERPA